MNIVLTIALILLALLVLFASLVYPILVGKPRKPVTRRDAVYVLAVNEIIVATMVLAAGRLWATRGY